MLSVFLLVLMPLASAVASEEVLSGPAPVRIWKSQAAMEKGMDLLATSAEVAALAPLVACEVAPGTRATVTRAERSYAWDAEVTEGPHQGCRGVVGPRDFKTPSELAPRGPVERSPTAPAPRTAAEPPQPTRPPDGGMILWYQLYLLDERGRNRTAWKPVAGWETASECDSARRRLADADEEEVTAILERFEVAARTSRGRITMTRVPSSDGLAVELSGSTREGRHSLRLELQSYCFPASYNPAH